MLLIHSFFIPKFPLHWGLPILLHIKSHGPLARYVKLWVAHALGMPSIFSSLLRVIDPDVHHSMSDEAHAVIACCDRWLAISYEVRGGGNFASIPGTCATHKFYVSGKKPMKLICGHEYVHMYVPIPQIWEQLYLYIWKARLFIR